MDIAQEILAIYRLARDGKITAREALEKAHQLRIQGR